MQGSLAALFRVSGCTGLRNYCIIYPCRRDSVPKYKWSVPKLTPVGGCRWLYSVECLEGVFSETEFLASRILGNWTSGIGHSRKVGFRHTGFSETQKAYQKSAEVATLQKLMADLTALLV